MTHASVIKPRRAASDDVVHDALRSARAAADTSATEIREVVEPMELEAISRMLSLVWNRQIDSRPMTSELLRALAVTGNYVTGAFTEGQLVGAAVGFFSAPPEPTLHSHITGVLSAHAARRVGYALKLHQRAWALQRGITTITWTFDPLVRRNAYFNLAKLGVRATEYLPNFYGAMQDPINAGDDTDRLLIVWELASPAVVAACDLGGAQDRSGLAQAARPPVLDPASLLSVAGDGSPVRSPWPGAGGAFIEVPADIETMRVAQPQLAHAWRRAVRETLGTVMADGATVLGFDRARGYIVVESDRAGADATEH